MLRRTMLLTTTLLGLPMIAAAQPVTGLYVGAGVGVNIQADQSTTTKVGGVTVGHGHADAEAGFAGLVNVGWGFGNGLRAEVEGNYRANSLNHGSGSAAPGGVSVGGWEQKFGPMVNALYDFNGLVPWLVPYVGVGIGYQGVNREGIHAAAPGVGVVTFNRSTAGSFAYQAIVGAAFPLTAIAPGLAATLEYRFLGLAGTRSDNGTAVPLAGPSVPLNVSSNQNYNHSILVGLRYNFGVAPPPPPAPAPAPAQAPARSYLVFFDWDKASLTDRARQIIAEAAANSTKVQYTRIEVNGYTDTSGTHQYNQGLSVRRAQAVAAELVKDGVPRNAITIQGFGDTHLLVPTGPGVREPQNRRVEIIIR